MCTSHPERSWRRVASRVIPAVAVLLLSAPPASAQSGGAHQSLDRITVVATSACVADARAGDVGTVWEAARRELVAAGRGASGAVPSVRVERFERERDRFGRTLAEQKEIALVRTAAPYQTLPPDVLSRDGYRLAGGDATLFFAPDAAALLSDEFARDHCFRLVEDPARPGEIGLAFEPVPSRDVVDIAGTFWLDRRTSSLHRVSYRYRNVGDLARLAEAGGEIEFGVLAGGIPAITAWQVRTPRIAPLGPSNARSSRYVAGDTLVGVREEGARMLDALEAETGTPTVGSAQDSLWIAGVVVGSNGVPLAGAAVRLEPGGREWRTDAEGAFRIRASAGPTRLVVRHLGSALFTADLELRGGADRRFRIEMSEAPRLLESVVTEARATYMPADAPPFLDDFYRRRAEAKGRTFTRGELLAAGGVRQALTTVAGVRVDSDAAGNLTDIRVPRCGSVDGSSTRSAVAWFIDGTRVGALPQIHEADVEAIEVYRSSSSLPAEAIGDACAAVYIWTRRSP